MLALWKLKDFGGAGEEAKKGEQSSEEAERPVKLHLIQKKGDSIECVRFIKQGQYLVSLPR